MITRSSALLPALIFLAPLATLAAPNSSVRVPLPPHYAIADLGAGQAIGILDDGEVLGTFNEGVRSGTDDKMQEWVLRGGERVPITPQDAGRLTYQSLMPGSVTQGGYRVACVQVNGKVQFLAVPPGVLVSNVEAVNKAGQAVGFCVSGYGRRAALWNLHTPGALPRILQPPGTSTGYAASINDAGLVVGQAKVTNSQREFGFVWHGGRFQDMGSLGPGKINGIHPVRINRSGQVVGNESDLTPVKEGFDLRQYPVLWEQGHLYALGRLLVDGSDWVLMYVVGLNDRGQIVGIGLHHRQPRVFLLTPSAGTQ